MNKYIVVAYSQLSIIDFLAMQSLNINNAIRRMTKFGSHLVDKMSMVTL